MTTATTTPFQIVESALRGKGCNPKPKPGGGIKACCPAHDDKNPSLDVDHGDKGKVLLYCRSAGCPARSIVDALDLEWSDLFQDDPSWKPSGNHKTRKRSPQTIREPKPKAQPKAKKSAPALNQCTREAEYLYRDADGNTLYKQVRFSGEGGYKTFLSEHPDGNQWKSGRGNANRVLYRLPELTQADPNEWVYLVEGEKDADNLAALGLVATTNDGGGGPGKWKHEYHAAPLKGRRVVILPDNDETGRAHEREVFASLSGLASEVRVVRLPGLEDKGDVSDWLGAGGTLDELRRIVDETEPNTLPDGGGDDEHPWLDPEPLDLDPDVPALDLEAMIGSACPELAAMVDWVHRAHQVPIDVPATMVLPVALSGLAHRVRLCAGGEHIERPAMFVIAKLDASERKTSGFTPILEPIKEWAKEEAARLAPIRQKKLRQKGRLEVRQARLSKQYNEADELLGDDNPIVTELDSISRDLDALDIPPNPLAILSTGSPEGIADAAHEYGGAVRMFASEPSVLEELMGRHSKSTQPEILNAGYDEDEYTDARRGRKKDGASAVQSVPAINVNLGLAVTDSAVDKLLRDSIAKDRGFVSRCLFISPDSLVGNRDFDPIHIPADIKTKYARAVYRLMNYPKPAGDPLEITLDSDAHECVIKLREYVERNARGDLAELGAWQGRLVSRTLRIALSLHAWRWAYGNDSQIPSTITGETMRAALEWFEYQIRHYRRSAAQSGGISEERQLSRKLVERMREKDLDQVTARDAHRMMESDARRMVREGSARTEKDAVASILEDAALRGWMREQAPPPRSGAGRKRSPDWVLNPILRG
jgi:putative DNA primase/helicase